MSGKDLAIVIVCAALAGALVVVLMRFLGVENVGAAVGGGCGGAVGGAVSGLVATGRIGGKSEN